MRWLCVVVCGLLAAGLCGCFDDPGGNDQTDCTQLVSECMTVSGQLSCPTSDDPLFNAVVDCLNEHHLGPTNEAFNCACYGPYYQCQNGSHDGGRSDYDGCSI